MSVPDKFSVMVSMGVVSILFHGGIQVTANVLGKEWDFAEGPCCLQGVSLPHLSFRAGPGHRQGLKGAAPPSRPLPLLGTIINWLCLGGCSQESALAACQSTAAVQAPSKPLKVACSQYSLLVDPDFQLLRIYRQSPNGSRPCSISSACGQSCPA